MWPGEVLPVRSFLSASSTGAGRFGSFIFLKTECLWQIACFMDSNSASLKFLSLESSSNILEAGIPPTGPAGRGLSPSQSQSGVNSSVPKGGILSLDACAKAPKRPLTTVLSREILQCCGGNISACFQHWKSAPILLCLEEHATYNCYMNVTTEASHCESRSYLYAHTWLKLHCVYEHFLCPLSVDGHWGGFPFLDLVTKTAMNMYMQISLW